MRNQPPSDRERLKHILEAIQAIFDFTINISEEQFLKDNVCQSAVLFQFVIIGEAAASLSLSIYDQYPYAWHKPRSFRNYIAHEYFGINLSVVWYTKKVQLPELKALVERILKELEKNSQDRE